MRIHSSGIALIILSLLGSEVRAQSAAPVRAIVSEEALTDILARVEALKSASRTAEAEQLFAREFSTSLRTTRLSATLPHQLAVEWGRFLNTSGSSGKAREVYLLCAEALKKAGLINESLDVMALYGNQLRVERKLAESEATLKSILPQLKEDTKLTAKTRVDVLRMLYGVINDQSRVAEARTYLEQARKAAQNQLFDNALASYQLERAYGTLLLNEDKLSESARVFEAAIPLAEKARGPKSRAMMYALDDAAYAWFKLGQHVKANEIYIRAAAVLEAAKLYEDPLAGVVLTGHSNNLLELGRINDAIKYADEAIALHKNLATKELTVPGAEVGLTRINLRLAAHQQLTNLWAAYSTPGITLSSKTALTARAFAAAQIATETFSSAAVNRLITVSASKSGTIRALLEERRQVQAKLFTAARNFGGLSLASDSSLVQAGESVQKIQALRDELAILDKKIKESAPDIVDAGQFKTVLPEQLSALLKPSEALIIIVPTTDGGTHILAATQAGIVTWNWIKEDDIALCMRMTALRIELDASRPINCINQNLQQIKGAPPAATGRFDRTAAHDLYKLLFASLEPKLKGKQDWRVVLSGQIAAMPLSALVMHAPKGDDRNPEALRRTHWLGREKALALLPSVSALTVFRSAAEVNHPRQPVRLAAIGNPCVGDLAGKNCTPRAASTQDIASLSITRSGNGSSDIRSLPALPGSVREMDAFARLPGVSATLLSGPQATEANLKAAQLGQQRVVVFSTHGLTTGEFGLREPALVLTPPESATESDNGLFTATEIAGLDLDAELVILTACNSTNAGELFAASDPLNDLGRMFFYAGARSILMSHYRLYDAPAERLGVNMLRQWLARPGAGKAEALRRATDALLKDPAASYLAHPKNWASLFLAGSPD
jgi:tetratricopeptide (TPR) repeat protein